MKFYFFFLPFGGDWFLTSDTSQILDEYKRRGATRQYQEGVKYSYLGLLFYFMIVIYILFFRG